MESTGPAPNPLGVPCGKVPDLEDWKRRVRSAPVAELLALQDTGYLGLRVEGNAFHERWAPYINAVEEEIQRRHINP
jgi:hypothetical protein